MGQNRKALLMMFILGKSFLLLFLIMGSAIGIDHLKETAMQSLYPFLAILCIGIIHLRFNRSMLLLISFNQVKRAVIERKASYVKLFPRERLLNSIYLFPVSFSTGVALYFTDILAIKLCMLLIILIFLVIGETSKYRFYLYKEWYDENLA